MCEERFIVILMISSSKFWDSFPGSDNREVGMHKPYHSVCKLVYRNILRITDCNFVFWKTEMNLDVSMNPIHLSVPVQQLHCL